jgi:hypothetical protein
MICLGDFLYGNGQTSSVVPVTNELCSDPRYHAALATSDGSVTLLIGIVSVSLSKRVPDSASSPMSFCNLNLIEVSEGGPRGVNECIKKTLH